MRHKLEYGIVRALIAAVRVMPGPLVRGCGSVLGLAFYTFDRAHRRIAKSNLAEALATVVVLGGNVIHPGERWAICKDSEGSPFGLTQESPEE